MSVHEPEPVNEFALGGVVEQRGGDSPLDYIQAVLQPADCVPGDGGCSCEDED